MKPPSQPCPFCGDKDVILVQVMGGAGLQTAKQVVCLTCKSAGPYGHNDDEAYRQWDRRVTSLKLVP